MSKPFADVIDKLKAALSSPSVDRAEDLQSIPSSSPSESLLAGLGLELMSFNEVVRGSAN